MSRVVRISEPSAPAAPDFDRPFEMLEACHQRVQSSLDLLQRLREHVESKGVDAQAQAAASDVLRYFDLAAPAHHLDEELHVFPPLLARGQADVVALVRRLQADHREMERRWRGARAVLTALVEGQLAALDAAAHASLAAFGELYAAHIQAEESIAFPAAVPLLDEAAIAAAGAEMRQRRGGR